MVSGANFISLHYFFFLSPFNETNYIVPRNGSSNKKMSQKKKIIRKTRERIYSCLHFCHIFFQSTLFVCMIKSGKKFIVWAHAKWIYLLFVCKWIIQSKIEHAITNFNRKFLLFFFVVKQIEFADENKTITDKMTQRQYLLRFSHTFPFLLWKKKLPIIQREMVSCNQIICSEPSAPLACEHNSLNQNSFFLKSNN